MNNVFGKALYNHRIKELKLTLRQFCKTTGYDPGYVSRLERGFIKAPRTAKLLSKLLGMYGIDAKQWIKFVELARKTRLEY